MQTTILWPTFALIALVFAVWFTMVWQRLGHMRRNPPGPGDLASGDAAQRYFRPVEMPGNNLTNLFEMPVVYFALVPLLIVTGHVTPAQVVVAWVYVLLRAGHSFVHIGPKQLAPRFMLYLASCVAISVMWIGFAVDVTG